MNSDWKIYTKTGDKGETSLIGGTRVPKYHERIEAYGTLDELNSFIGLIRDQGIDNATKELLIEIQDRIFTAESLLAADPSVEVKMLPLLHEEDIKLLESAIDKMNESLPPLTSFILPGGHQAVSLSHVARCVCRRSERLTIKLFENNKETLQGEMVIKYLNRLSDFLFVLARKFAVDFKVEETTWKARI
ncbi:MAG: ATP:cob(I)alamin adenosyltransferase [Bacteroidetes bacterium HGW-Bacteroidetes-9]|jgi:cob(I)alamin adenosyltransferase|nr:MAG: ATP:cob(I)alamin adenosyltransferase [Bacteroidetes bacterium HGW-Bacteroidetes-9]